MKVNCFLYVKAILHNDEVIKRRCLLFWLQRSRKTLHERKLEVKDKYKLQINVFIH